MFQVNEFCNTRSISFLIHSERNNDTIGIVRMRALVCFLSNVTRKDYLDAGLELIIN